MYPLVVNKYLRTSFVSAATTMFPKNEYASTTERRGVSRWGVSIWEQGTDGEEDTQVQQDEPELRRVVAELDA